MTVVSPVGQFVFQQNRFTCMPKLWLRVFAKRPDTQIHSHWTRHSILVTNNYHSPQGCTQGSKASLWCTTWSPSWHQSPCLQPSLSEYCHFWWSSSPTRCQELGPFLRPHPRWVEAVPMRGCLRDGCGNTCGLATWSVRRKRIIFFI